MTEIDHLLAKIDAHLAAHPDLSDRAISLKSTSSADTIRNIRRHRELPKQHNLSGLADFLGLSTDQLVGRVAASDGGPMPQPLYGRVEAEQANLGDVSRMFRDMPQGLPVYGTALGHNIQFGDDGAADIETTLFEPTSTGALLYVARPPALMGVKEAYAIYVQGDSMAPAHKNGALRFVNPRAPLRIDDDVVVQLRAPTDADGDDGEEIVSILIKTLVKRKAEFVMLEQLNPHHRFTVPMARVAAIHRVMENDDLYRR